MELMECQEQTSRCRLIKRGHVSTKRKSSRKNKVCDDRMRSDEGRVDDNKIENRIIEE